MIILCWVVLFFLIFLIYLLIFISTQILPNSRFLRLIDWLQTWRLLHVKKCGTKLFHSTVIWNSTNVIKTERRTLHGDRVWSWDTESALFDILQGSLSLQKLNFKNVVSNILNSSKWKYVWVNQNLTNKCILTVFHILQDFKLCFKMLYLRAKIPSLSFTILFKLLTVVLCLETFSKLVEEREID